MLAEKIQLESDEKILKQVRKHWFILFAKVFGLVIAAIAPLILYVVFQTFTTSFVTEALGSYTSHLLLFYTIWLIFIWMALFNVWTDYYLDVWTVTNRRLIAVDQRGLFHRTIGSFRLERLQDVNTEVHGVIATLLDYGTLEAETAGGDEDEFKAHGLPKPQELKSTILKATDDLIDTYRDRPRLSEDGV